MATITGGNGNDTLNGTGGADYMYPLLGSNSVNGQGGNDSIYSVGGTDTINGGSGTDYWDGDYSGSATARTFTWNAATGAGSLTGGTTLTSIERAIFTAGGGGDAVTINGNVAAYGTFVDTGAGNDTITTRVGGAQISGGDGTDSITVDLTTQTNAVYVSLSESGADGFYGSYDAFGSYSSFYDVERVTIKGGSGDDSINVDTAPLASGATVSIDGGAGNDTLSVYFSAFTNSNFIVGAGGTITSNHGSYANLERFNVTLGSGANTVTTGADNDVIYSVGGNDVVNGGSGSDAWYGDYSGSATARTFTWNAATGVGSLTSGTTLTSIEQVSFTGGTRGDTVTIDGNVAAYGTYVDTGAGNDTITTRVGGAQIFGGAGADNITVDLTAEAAGNYVTLDDSGAGEFYGSYDAFGYGSSFYEFERVTIKGGSGDDFISVDTAPLASGATVAVDGGAGSDTLFVNYAAFNNVSLVVAAGGAITSNHGNFSNLEVFSVTLGSGENTVTTGAGDDVVYSFGGSDVVNGGSGSDQWYGDYSGSAAARTFTWNAATGAGSLTGGTTLTGVEYVHLTSGDGNDTATIDGNTAAYNTAVTGGAGNDSITLRVAGVYAYGGDGTDSLTIDLAADTNADYLYLNDDGIGGITGNYGAFGYSTNFYEMERVTAKGGSAGDSFSGASGADTFFGNGGNDTLTGNGGNDSLDGGGGIDVLTGGLGNDTYVVGNLSDVTNEAVAEGTDTIRSSISLSLSSPARANIENLTLIGNGANSATGSAANNTLTGNAAANLLSGLDGVDRLVGGGGADTLDGGNGADKFVFNALTDSGLGSAHDTILAFDGLGATAGDQIDVSKIDADSGTAGNQAFSFIGVSAFTVGVAGQLHAVASGADSLVQGDVNGDGVADFEILVKNAAAGNWAASDFVL